MTRGNNKPITPGYAESGVRRMNATGGTETRDWMLRAAGLRPSAPIALTRTTPNAAVPSGAGSLASCARRPSLGYSRCPGARGERLGVSVP